MDRSAHWLQRLLSRPMKVFFYCLVFSGLSLLLNGGLIRLYSLHRDQSRLITQISDLKTQVGQLEQQMLMAKDPAFIQRQALDRYDLATENDLVFVFADE